MSRRRSRRHGREWCRRRWSQRPPKDPLAGIDAGESRSRRSEQRLDLAEYQVAAGHERVEEGIEKSGLRVAVEVDENVAARDQLELSRRRRIIQEIASLEADHAAHVRRHRERRRSREIAVA